MSKFHLLNDCSENKVKGLYLFLADCWHDLKGQIVEIPEWEDV